MGAAHFQHILEFLSLRLKALCQPFQRIRESHSLVAEAYLDGSGEYVVSGLGHIGMVIRRNDIIAALFIAKNFKSTVAQNLIHIHVDGSACAALDGIQRKLVQHFAVHDFISSLDNGFSNGLVHAASLQVGEAGRLFHGSHGFDEIRIQMSSGNLEIFLSPHGLNPIVNFIRY